MKKFLQEFKAFAMRGNVLDMAVGVVVGGAFNAIVTSLVNDIISPVIGLFFNTDFSDLAITVGDVSVAYGSFVTAVVNFLIVAFTLFVVIKTVNKANSLTHKPKAPAAPTEKEGTYCFRKSPLTPPRCPHCTSGLEAAAEANV